MDTSKSFLWNYIKDQRFRRVAFGMQVDRDIMRGEIIILFPEYPEFTIPRENMDSIDQFVVDKIAELVNQ